MENKKISNKKKIGFIVTTHWSKAIRPDAGSMLIRFFNSIYQYCNYNFHIYIIDNESEFALEIPDDNKCTYFRVDNQFEKGLTGAWNIGINLAYKDGCDVLINCNDDLWFNETINIFIQTIYNNITEYCDVIFTAVSNGVLSGLQRSSGPKKGIARLDCTGWHNTVNGYFFAMTRDHYEKFRFTETEYFDCNNVHNEGDGKWGGQEGQFVVNQSKGLYGLVIQECFVHHDKIRDWKKARDIEKGNL